MTIDIYASDWESSQWSLCKGSQFFMKAYKPNIHGIEKLKHEILQSATLA